ncbi:superoxide dismutase [Novosphingobium terrae]|uniref:superoxide dismutase n=1 Tax=Novosphingobium terrae TaxID=2726189 RepID=UPI001980572A|nr:superoxide dismutase [Novosphingobium terrae]
MHSDSRRGFMQSVGVAGGLALMASANAASAAEKPAPRLIDKSPQTLPPLPFAQDALAPVISARTVDFHYNKHHAGYYTNLAKLVANTPLATASLEEVVLASAGNPERRAIFNNAAQAWNHNLYWQSLSPKASTPSGGLAAAIARDFQTQTALEAELSKAAVGQFGSGWAWLVLDGGRLKVVATSNAENPLASGAVPLLVIDVWEHAYYLDEQNRRADYVEGVVHKLLNWDNASRRFAAATA